MNDATTAASRRRNFWIHAAVFAYGALIAAIFAFVVYRSSVLVASTIDVNCFGQLARNVLQGKGFSFGYGPTIRRGPFYPLLAAGLLKLFGRDPHAFPDAAFYAPVLAANCLFFGATCLVVYSLARRLFGTRAAVLAVTVCPFVPQSLRYVGRTEVETLMALFISLLAATGLALATRPAPRTGAWFGLVAALSTLTKPIVLVYPFAFLPFVWWHWVKNGVPTRARLVALAALFVCFAVPLVPWSLRNRAVTDDRFGGISSNGPGEFLRGYVNVQPKYFLLRQDFGGSDPRTEKWDPEANLYEERLLKAHGLSFGRPVYDDNGTLFFDPPPPPGTTSALLEAEKDRIEGAEMKRRVFHEPVAFVGKLLVQIVTFWYIVETRAKSLFVGAVALFMLAFAVAGFMSARRRGNVVWPIALPLVYFNVMYAAFLAFARYSMPLFPTLVILSAGGFWAAYERFTRPSLKAAGVS
jgi:4-amino-4-deoxy-L-arabinose transferase-like glycosyltransferase